MNRSIISIIMVSLISTHLFAISERDVQNATRDRQTAEFAVTGAKDALAQQKQKLMNMDLTQATPEEFKKEIQNLQTQFDFYVAQVNMAKGKNEAEKSIKIQYEAIQKMKPSIEAARAALGR